MYLNENRHMKKQVDATNYFAQKFLAHFEARYPNEFKTFLEKAPGAKTYLETSHHSGFFSSCLNLMDINSNYKTWVKKFAKGEMGPGFFG